jgi:hypothetical protein
MEKKKIKKRKRETAKLLAAKPTDHQSSTDTAEDRDFGGMNMENFKKNLGCGG